MLLRPTIQSFIRQSHLGRQQRQMSAPLSTSMVAQGGDIFAGKGAAELRNRDPGQCSKETPLLTQEEIATGLISIPAWVLNSESTQISRSFVAKNFVSAIDFFKGVAQIAEEANHHPDLHLTEYRNVEVVLSTHAVGGLSAQDLILAARIDALPVTYSPKWYKQQQQQEAAAQR